MKKFITLMMICIVLVGVFGSPAYGVTPVTPELDVLNLIPPELLIIVLVIYCIGMFLKAVEKIPNWTIPPLLLGFAILITVAYMAVSLGQGVTPKTIIDGIIYGIIIASVAVFANQMYKQVFKERLKE